MRVAVTGASGLVGHPITRHLAALGHQITTFGRSPVDSHPHVAWDLNGPAPDLAAQDWLIHAAFDHVPGRYRGGEGNNAQDFLRSNLDGTLRLWDAARRVGARVIFFSTRAVYGEYPPGAILREEMPARPDTLYGEAKLAAEAALGDLGVSLRLTGVYGPPVPGRAHKWQDLFARFLRGEAVPSRIGTEVHSDDVASAVALALDGRVVAGVFNVSDFVLDHRMLLESLSRIAGHEGPLPAASDPSTVSVMDTEHLRRLGWAPRGADALDEVVATLADALEDPPA